MAKKIREEGGKPNVPTISEDPIGVLRDALDMDEHDQERLGKKDDVNDAVMVDDLHRIAQAEKAQETPLPEEVPKGQESIH